MGNIVEEGFNVSFHKADFIFVAIFSLNPDLGIDVFNPFQHCITAANIAMVVKHGVNDEVQNATQKTQQRAKHMPRVTPSGAPLVRLEHTIAIKTTLFWPKRERTKGMVFAQSHLRALHGCTQTCA